MNYLETSVRFPTGAEVFSFLDSVQTCPREFPVSHPKITEVYFLWS
jgi:hypothetical protein